MGSNAREHPLLRTLVVCGASLVGLGCGGRAESHDADAGGQPSATDSGGQASGGGGGGSAATTIRCPAQCSSPAQFVCDDAKTATNCRCDEAAPSSSSACETVWDYACQSFALGADCGLYIEFGPTLACTCASGRLHPEDCEYTSQFTCDVYAPVADGCRCVTGAPQGPQDCPAGLAYSCYQHDPEIGCRCERIDLIK